MSRPTERPNRVEHAYDLVGYTPVVRLNRIVPAGSAKVYVKLESANPGGSVKDRIALSMIQDAEVRGLLKPGSTLLEATSGNTGIGLAFVAAAKGFKITLVIAVEPETSPLLSTGQAGPHKIQGIGPNFVPSILNRGAFQRIRPVGYDDAIAIARRLAREEGLLTGISTGAIVFAALEVAKELGEGKTVVAILCDTGERYLTHPLFAEIDGPAI